MKKILLTAVLTAIVTFTATSIWWASTDDGKCEFTTNRRVQPEIFVVFDGLNVDSSFTYREP